MFAGPGQLSSADEPVDAAAPRPSPATDGTAARPPAAPPRPVGAVRDLDPGGGGSAPGLAAQWAADPLSSSEPDCCHGRAVDVEAERRDGRRGLRGDVVDGAVRGLKVSTVRGSQVVQG